MYLKRKIDAYLAAWKADPERKPLIVKGARQIGKTESIRRFSEGRYKSVVEINFALEPKYKTITEEGYDVESIIKHISLLDPSKEVLPGKTLIFFDELQEFPEIATALKAFCQDQRYDVICSGSLLGVHYRRIQSISVGYKIDYDMYSLDFEEYLWAVGYADVTTQDLLDHMKRLIPFSESEMVVFRRLFLDYCVLGGMPGVVRSYIERGNFSGSLALQRQLLLDYEEDVRKYAEGLDQTKILSVYRHVPTQLAKENKKFQYSVVERGARSKDYDSCLSWIEDAGILHHCYNLSIPELPLDGNSEEDIFKVYMADTGLFISMLEDGTQADILQGNLLGYKGAIFENLVADFFGKMGRKLYYFRKDSGLEIDFVIKYKGKATLVEVKATNGNAKSMKQVLANPDRYHVEQAIKLADAQVERNGQVLTLPLYMGAFITAVTA